MYDHPGARSVTDRWWAALAEALGARGVASPLTLDRRLDHATVWLEPGLVLSQTCGYPYHTRLRGRVQLVATPVYCTPGCEGARYRSALVVRADEPAQDLSELRGRCAAFNATDSQSGYNALRRSVAPLADRGRFFLGQVATGSHVASAAAVASGAADLCAIDCVTWAMLGKYQPEVVAGLRVLGYTLSAPGLPLITAATAPVERIRDALTAVLAAPELAATREALFLDGLELLDEAAYDEIGRMEDEAAACGYPTLA